MTRLSDAMAALTGGDVAEAPARGYAAVCLFRPKTLANVGGVFRAAHCYRASLVILAGDRRLTAVRHCATDTMRAWKHIPVLQVDDPFDAHPLGAVPVAVDLVPDAVPLPAFKHPERAYYVFGPEDGTLGGATLARCAHRVMVPTRHSMNLASCVNVVLYDRLAKRGGA